MSRETLPRDYDPILAQIAGTLAAGFVGTTPLDLSQPRHAETLAKKSVLIALAIVRRCQAIQDAQADAKTPPAQS